MSPCAPALRTSQRRRTRWPDWGSLGAARGELTMDDWFEVLTHVPAYGRSEMQGALALLLAVGLLLTWVADLLIGLVEPRVGLGPDQRGWLALAAPYFVVHEFREGDLGGLRPLGRRRVRRFLREGLGTKVPMRFPGGQEVLPVQATTKPPSTAAVAPRAT